MDNESGIISKIKNVIIDINPQDVLKDANQYGILVNTIDDFAKHPHNYIFIEKLSSKYVDVSSRYCAISGAGTGVGGIATTVALAGVDLSNMAAQLYRLNQKLAILHGFDPANALQQDKVLTIYLAALGIDAAVDASIRTVVTKAAQEIATKPGVSSNAIIKIIMIVAKSLGVKITKGTAIKMVPGVGALLGGGVNYVFSQKAGKKMITTYKSDYFDRWQLTSRQS